MRPILFLVFITLLQVNLSAQSTYTEVYNLIQTSCQNMTCHNGAGGETPSGQLAFNGTAEEVYANLIGIDPTNPAADDAGFLRVDPGYPHNSYFMKKINNALDPTNDLGDEMGEIMPKDQPPLEVEQIELVRQWIQYGAPMTGEVVDLAVIDNYYNLNGLPKIDVPVAPAPGEGYQMHFGPVFLEPGNEKEWIKKHKLTIPDGADVTGMEVFMNEESHHFILYKYEEGDAGEVEEGIQDVNTVLDLLDLNLSGRTMGTWQYDRAHALPAGTAYKWEEDPVLNLNYHIPNSNMDSILACEVYINVYTEPSGTVPVEMFAGLAVYGGDNPFLLNIPGTGEDHTLTWDIYDEESEEVFNIWLLQAHTHKLGKDFDIYLRNEDGTKGEQIYEGFFDPEYTFNQGYYDYAHPAIREFEPLLPVDFNKGFIQEATWNNPGPDPALP